MSCYFNLYEQSFHFVLKFILFMSLADDGGRQSKRVAGNIIYADVLYVQAVGLFSKADKKKIFIVHYCYARVA